MFVVNHYLLGNKKAGNNTPPSLMDIFSVFF